jgi:hypothetical protein
MAEVFRSAFGTCWHEDDVTPGEKKLSSPCLISRPFKETYFGTVVPGPYHVTIHIQNPNPPPARPTFLSLRAINSIANAVKSIESPNSTKNAAKSIDPSHRSVPSKTQLNLAAHTQ